MSDFTRDHLETWLTDLTVRHYLCPNCEGIHLTDLEEQVGVLESRIFLDDGLIIISTELPIRPSAVLPLHGSLNLVNFEHPLVKVTLNLNDDEIPRLVISATLIVNELSPTYFNAYLSAVTAGSLQVLEHATALDVLFLDEPELDLEGSGDSLH
jgi:hypothetical protein